MMTEQEVVNELQLIYNQESELGSAEVALEMLDTLDLNRDDVQFDVALKQAYRELNIWSRTEEDTGDYLDRVVKLLNLKVV